MQWILRLRTFCLVSLVIGVAACSEPPDRELNQAQGAIDAARAAGGAEYAADEFGAAVAALEKARQAVAAGDYRLALNDALDARERAQEAAKQAASARAVLRGQNDAALASITGARERARAVLDQATAARLPASEIAGPRAVIDDADRAVQEARAALSRGDDLAAGRQLAGLTEKLTEAATALEASLKARQTRRRR
jgi:hypothetical protein